MLPQSYVFNSLPDVLLRTFLACFGDPSNEPECSETSALIVMESNYELRMPAKCYAKVSKLNRMHPKYIFYEVLQPHMMN